VKKAAAPVDKKALIAFAESVGIDDINPKWDVARVKEELLEYELEEADLDEATVSFIKANGLSAMLG
jgi:hypothetical protein